LVGVPESVMVFDSLAGCSYIEAYGTAESDDIFEIEVDRSVLIDPVEMVWNVTYELGDTGTEEQPSSSVSVHLDSAGDLFDLEQLVSEWLWVGDAGSIAEDLSGDGRVDFADFAIFAEGW